MDITTVDSLKVLQDHTLQLHLIAIMIEMAMIETVTIEVDFEIPGKSPT
jgi:hypothetical protein